MHSLIIAIIIGILSGYLYGLFFLLQRRRVFTHQTTQKKYNNIYVYSFFFMAMRITILALLWYYLLPLGFLHFIIIMVCFFLSFWFVIAQKVL